MRLSLLSPILFVALSLISFKTSAQQVPVYPRIVGYFSVTNPIGTLNKDGFKSNFDGEVYTIAFPFGMNIIKSDHFGVSFEVSPSIRTEKQISKVNTVVFHPGAMFRFAHGFTFIGRVAFETNGRFGVTPVFNQVVIRGKNANFFASIPVPVRFGNDQPTSVGTGLQLGVSF
jgi:hypothetical protein